MSKILLLFLNMLGVAHPVTYSRIYIIKVHINVNNIGPFWAHLCLCTVGSYALLSVCPSVRCHLTKTLSLDQNPRLHFLVSLDQNCVTWPKLKLGKLAFHHQKPKVHSMIEIANCNSVVKSISHVTGRCALFNVKLHFLFLQLATGLWRMWDT